MFCYVVEYIFEQISIYAVRCIFSSFIESLTILLVVRYEFNHRFRSGLFDQKVRSEKFRAGDSLYQAWEFQLIPL